jgi:RNA polymerase sigma factor (sigma-70 family)
MIHLNDRPINQQEDKDAGLLQRILMADESALELLYHRYYHRLYRFIGRIMWQEDRIEEVINDVMFTVWEKASTYNYQCQLSTWIFGIAFNKARQSIRSAGSLKEESLDEMELENPVFGIMDSGLKQFELSDWLDTHFNKLSPEQRAVVELTFFEGLHYSEIAILMDCPENTVKTRMHHARKILAMHLTNDGGITALI